MARIICSFGLVGYAYIYPVYCSVSKGCIVVCSFLFLQPRYRGPSRVIELAADTFESLVLSCKDKVWIIEFYLTWSDNVKHFEPLLAKLSLEYSNNNNTLCFGRFNVSRYPTIGAKYGIDLNTCSKMIPTLVVKQQQFCKTQLTLRRNMLDINLFRVEKGGNPSLVLESQRKSLLMRLLCRNKEIGIKKRKNEDTEELVAKVADIKKAIAVTEQKIEELEGERDHLLKSIGNIVHESVFVSRNEEENPIIRYWGEREGSKKRWNHVDLLHMIDGVEYERGVRVAGNRGYYLKGPAVSLNLALIQYGLQFLQKKGYLPIQTPYFMERDAMANVHSWKTLMNNYIKLVTGEDTQEKYLIATAEQPICCYHMDEWIDPKSLPMRYVGFSTCFRKEVSISLLEVMVEILWVYFESISFEKLEQFCLTAPDPTVSYAMMEEMLGNAEEFYQSLKNSLSCGGYCFWVL
eukprot:jgi/Galph1/5036/GphlegSOOS_G53.1